MKKLGAVFVLCAFAVCACGGGRAPTVESTNASGKRIYPTSAISVTFSAIDAMDQASVEAAFQITGSGPVAGTFSWSENTVTFTPETLLKTLHPYTLTILGDARDMKGNTMDQTFTQTFKPVINMTDFNGDGIDDLAASAPLNDESGPAGGMVYLFLGKTSWTDVDLAAQTADVQYNVEGGTDLVFGWAANIVGDINGDGYADMLVSSPVGSPVGVDRGLVAVIYGSAAPASQSFSLADTSMDVFIGETDEVNLGLGVLSAGDVNGDGLADFMIGASYMPDDFRFWLVLGQSTPYGNMRSIADIAAANYIVGGNFDYWTQMYRSCDVNGDELNDIVISSFQANGNGIERGQVYYIAGSDAPASLDLRSQAATATFTGAADGDMLGFSFLNSCGDVNADGYDDLLMSSPFYSGAKGISYLVLGSASPVSLDFATDSASATFIGSAPMTGTGLAASIPGDVNNDGFNDIISSAPLMTISGLEETGQAYLFLGSAAPASVDLSSGGTAAATYTGELPPPALGSVFGFSKPVGDVNGDGIDDMVFNAIGAPDGTARGRIYIIFGSATPVSLDFETQSADATITGHADGDLLGFNALFL